MQKRKVNSKIELVFFTFLSCYYLLKVQLCWPTNELQLLSLTQLTKVVLQQRLVKTKPKQIRDRGLLNYCYSFAPTKAEVLLKFYISINDCMYGYAAVF
jgi:hypothetical protein